MSVDAPTPALQARTARPELYADLDAEGLAAAFKAYAETYDGGWARAVAAAVRAYEDKRWKPGSVKPEEGVQVLAVDDRGNQHLVRWTPTRMWFGENEFAIFPVNVVRWTYITRPKS